MSKIIINLDVEQDEYNGTTTVNHIEYCGTTTQLVAALALLVGRIADEVKIDYIQFLGCIAASLGRVRSTISAIEGAFTKGENDGNSNSI